MTRDEILRMAQKAGLQPYYDAQNSAIERFANLVAAAERDRNAKLCDALAVTSEVSYAKTCHECAEAIRGQK